MLNNDSKFITSEDSVIWFKIFFNFFYQKNRPIGNLWMIIDVRGLQGISTASEIAASDLIDLTDFIVENQIPSVIVENSVPMRKY